MLTEKELTIARLMISKMPSGQYKLNELYGDLWKTNKSPTTFGKRFKKCVLEGNLANISLVEKDGDNAWIYLVN